MGTGHRSCGYRVLCLDNLCCTKFNDIVLLSIYCLLSLNKSNDFDCFIHISTGWAFMKSQSILSPSMIWKEEVSVVGRAVDHLLAAAAAAPALTPQQCGWAQHPLRSRAFFLTYSLQTRDQNQKVQNDKLSRGNVETKIFVWGNGTFPIFWNFFLKLWKKNSKKIFFY